MIKIIEENINSYLYHSVDDQSYEYVKKNGITTDSHGFIYLSKYPIKNSILTHVFRVKIPDNNYLYDWKDFWTDDYGNEIDFDHEYDPQNPYYIYTKNIPIEYIEEKNV